MADFKFSCPNCGQRLSGEDSWRGAQINCPTCNTVITVPQAASTPPAPGLKISTQSAPPPVLAPPPAAAPPAAAPAARRAPTATSSALNIPWAGIIAIVLVFFTIPANIIIYQLTHVPLLGTPLLLIALFLAHGSLETSRIDRSTVGRIVAVIALTLSYLMAVFLAWAAYRHFTHPRSNASSNQSRFVIADNPARETPSRPAAPPRPPDPRVTTNPLKVEIPDVPISGTIGGQNFTCDRATLWGGFLKLEKGREFTPDASLQFPIDLAMGESIAGKKIVVTSAATVPHGITITWREGNSPNSDIIGNNYALRLEFGTPANGKVPAKMYLEASQSHKTKLAGTFDVEMK